MEKLSSTKSALSGKNLLVLALFALVLVLSGASAFLFIKVQKLSSDPEIVAKEEAAALLAEVGELILLPPGEEPTIATVTDPEQLKAQAFFANTAADDRVLLYTGAKKAILYRPSTKQIVEVAPINIGDNSQAVPVEPSQDSVQTE